jgi:O-succinylhomoserine sulfhydrylase
MRAHCDNAMKLAAWLEAHPAVERVYYPGLASHPQHELARRQQSGSGGVVSFEVKGGREAAWRVIDSTKLLSITANLGDTKTTVTHPYTTSHGRLSPEAKAAAGLRDTLVRVSVGLEHIGDIQRDLERGLDK